MEAAGSKSGIRPCRFYREEDFQEPFKLCERTDLLCGKMRKEGTETVGL